jgi:fructuronate reductase
MSGKRLSSLEDAAAGVRLPGYNPADHGVGIVHLGLGAFHRAHQAVYTDDVLAAHDHPGGGDWRITGVSLRGTAIADALNSQNGLYTLLERGEEGTSARIIASIAGVIAATRDRPAVLSALADPCTRIVSMTVTEKAYGIERASGSVIADHPAIANDLADPRAPIGVVGLLVEGLRLRRQAGLAPFTVLCCDNLPENGSSIRSGVLDFAARTDPGLSDWIDEHVAFPSTMVDRITPAVTEATLADAARLTGLDDLAAVETEPFSQWVIEDHFPAGRPAWEAGGAIFVSDVGPYEQMKLRVLNGSHSLIAYTGFLAGHTYVRDVMGFQPLARLVWRHMRAAAATLSPLEGIHFDDYCDALASRFANPAIAHETYQIAMDGTEKLPQRLLEPSANALEHGQDIRPFAFAVAAWMRYCIGRGDDGAPYDLRDPREDEIRTAVASARSDAHAICDALHALTGLFPAELTSNAQWRATVGELLALMLEKGMGPAIEHEAARDPA